MTKYIRLFLLFFILINHNDLALAQEQKGFDQELLQELRQDSDYAYEIVKPEPEGFFSRLWQRFMDWFWGLFESEGSRSALDIFFKLLLATAFVYFLIKVLGGDIDGFLRPSKKELDLDYEIDEESLKEINFTEEIAQAKRANNLRLVIRLYYLMALKQASDANWVKLAQGKTNHEYLYDLKGRPIESQFKSLSYIFDYTWYGHFEADQKLVDKAQNLIDEISIKGKGDKNG